MGQEEIASSKIICTKTNALVVEVNKNQRGFWLEAVSHRFFKTRTGFLFIPVVFFLFPLAIGNLSSF